MALDDGEGGEDVGGGVAVEAVEVEVEGVEAGSEVASLFGVPGERGSVVAEVAGEGGHVVGSVGEAEDVVADEVGGGAVAEGAVVGVRRDERKLLEQVETEIDSMHLLSSNEVKTEAVEISYNEGRIGRR